LLSLKDPQGRYQSLRFNIKLALHACQAYFAKYFKLAYNPRMDTKTAISLAGSATELAKLLGVTRQAISQWGENLPQQRIWQLQVLRPKWFKS
jgi:tRNA U34 5-methylaminomethyl-2-thiouridine-forming methyltransferase MnmC